MAADERRLDRGVPGTILGDDFVVACGTGALRLNRVQRAGRPATSGDAFLRGAQAKRPAGGDWPILA